MKVVGISSRWLGDGEVRVTGRGQQRIAQLYAEHAPGAARLAFLLTNDKELAEDLTQEAFAKILGRFGDLKSHDAFRSYLRTTVTNLARGHFRRLKIERSWRQSQRTPTKDHLDQPDHEQQDEMWQRLSALPYRQRAAVVLRYYEDLSEGQAADILGCSAPAVKSLVARAMESMRAQSWEQEG